LESSRKEKLHFENLAKELEATKEEALQTIREQITESLADKLSQTPPEVRTKELRHFYSLFPEAQNPQEAERQLDELRATERNSNNLARALAASLEDWETVGNILAPETGHAFAAAAKAQELLQKLRKQQESTMGNPEDRMSGAPPGDLTREQLEYLWKDIPEKFRATKKLRPATIQQLRDFLEQLSCPHPYQAACALGDESGQQEWDASLEQMNNLASHTCRPTQNSEERSRLFKASEVPEFTSTREYDDYRSSLKMFFLSTEAPASYEYGTALLRILGTFKDPVARQAAKGWDVSTLIHPTSWPITWNSFLAALDDKFQSATLLQDTVVEWKRCRPKPEEKPVEFFNRFEALTTQLIDVKERTAAPAMTDSEISERLLTVLPAYLTTDARRQFGQKGELLESKKLKELRKYFEISWAYLPKPAATGHNTTRNFQTASGKAAPAHNHITAKEPKTYLCGFHGNYDTSPAVPAKFRGSIFADPRNPANNAENLARKKLCCDAGLCINCRRDHSQHPTIGSNFKPIHMNPTARRGPANSESPTNDQGQRLLEAPPAIPA
jgi:hypothetical protein